jgi:hypothetical protein
VREVLAAELADLAEQVPGLPLTGRADGLGPQHDTVLADQHGRAVTDARTVEPQTVGLADRTLGVEVGEQRVVDATHAVGPGLVAELGIDGDTQNLGIRGLEIALDGVEAGDLPASCRREVEGIEDQQHVLGALEAGQRDLLLVVAVELEIGGFLPGLDDAHGERRYALEPISARASTPLTAKKTPLLRTSADDRGLESRASLSVTSRTRSFVMVDLKLLALLAALFLILALASPVVAHL